MASTGLSDTQSYSVIFQDTNFDDHEYMFMTTLENATDLTMDNLIPKPTDLGIIDDVTMVTFLRRVPRAILDSSAYELSDAESPEIPVPPSPFLTMDFGYIGHDPNDERDCTRKLELYYRIAMEVQDVDAQPLYYGNKPRPGGVEIMTTQFSRCHVYLKPGERLRVRRGERKTANRRGALEAMLRQIWRGYWRQVGEAYPELNPRYMFIYEGRVFRIRPKAIYALTPFHYQSYLEI